VSTTKRRVRLVSIGDNCVDVFRPSGNRLVGGNAVNVAVQFVRVGGDACYLGAVGQDADGALTEQLLRRNRVDLTYLDHRDLPTARTEIEIEPDGDRRIVREDFGACLGYSPADHVLAALGDVDHFHIGWLNDKGATRRRLIASGRSVSQDISVNADQDDLEVAELAIVFASLSGSHADAGRLARSLRARGARNIVITRGASGSSLFFDAAAIDITIQPIRAIDTTGAGDSYIAAFLYAWLSGAPDEAAARAATDHAAKTCLHLGGFPQMD
jgi:fructoselysine 6-kinase